MFDEELATVTASLPRQPERSVPSTVRTLVRHVLTNRRLRTRHMTIRSRDPDLLERTYGAMTDEEFGDVNGPQELLNEFVIPRALRGFRRDRPWRIVDLGCGNGGSSAILARLAPPRATLIGYDRPESLLAAR
jgi:SAM-dependent methyltransferase